MQRTMWMSVALVLCASSRAFAQTQAAPERRVRFEIAEKTAGFVPALSGARVSLPLSVFFREGFLSRIDADVAYLADSPWFWPSTYFEVRGTLDFLVRQSASLDVAIGLGSSVGDAISSGDISVPLIVNAVARWRPHERILVRPELDFSLYGEGYGAAAHVAGFWRFFETGPSIGLGAGYEFLSEWEWQGLRGTWQATLALACEL